MALNTSTPVSADRFQDYCSKKQRRYVLIAAILASAMGFIDGSVVAIAIPAIRESLGASITDTQWINNAYMLALSSLILFGGAAGDRFGLTRIFKTGIIIFVLGSALCAIAWTSPILIGSRLIQGIGAALMVPGSLAIIAKTYPKEERGRAIGIWAASSALTTAIGPVLGGFLLSTGYEDAWRLIFAINLPVGAFVLYLMFIRIPNDKPVSEAKLDVRGAVLATLGLGLVAWALTGPEGESGAPEFTHIALYGVIGLAVILAFIWSQRQAEHPMMPLRLFASRAFSAANVVTFVLYFALSTILFYLPMTLITGWGLAEAQVGFIFVPMTLAIAIGSGPIGKLAERTGPRPLIALGSAIIATSYAILAIGIGWQIFWLHIFLCMCLMGIGLALVVAPLSAAVMGAVDDPDIGAASGINNAVSRMAGLIAVAAMGGVATTGYMVANGPGGFGQPLPQLPEAHAIATNAGFATLAWITAALSALSAVIALIGLPNRDAKPEVDQTII